MNFNKAKKILIFLFAFLNLFLIFQLSKMSDSRTTVSTSSIRKTITLAESRGLYVSEDVIPRKLEVLSFLELSNPLHNKEQFQKELTSYKKFNATDKNFHVEYSSENFSDEKDLLKFLNKSGFSQYALKFENKISNPITNDEIYFYRQSYNSHPIYGSNLNATLNDNKLLYASGNVYKINNANPNNYKPVSPLQIILSLARSLEGKKVTVNDIEQCYYIPLESKDYSNITAIPCYVLDVNSYKFVYDAEKGDFLVCMVEDGSYIYEISDALYIL